MKKNICEESMQKELESNIDILTLLDEGNFTDQAFKMYKILEKESI